MKAAQANFDTRPLSAYHREGSDFCAEYHVMASNSRLTRNRPRRLTFLQLPLDQRDMAEACGSRTQAVMHVCQRITLVAGSKLGTIGNKIEATFSTGSRCESAITWP